MTGTPCCLAFLITAAADGLSRLTISSTFAPLVEHLIGDRGELRLVAVGVLDVRLHARGLERVPQERAVRVLPARRRRGVGQDHADLGLGLRRAWRPTRCCRCSSRLVAATGRDGERERRRTTAPATRMVSLCFMYSPSSGYRRLATICEFEVFIAEYRSVKR